jgi:hypothetical protein
MTLRVTPPSPSPFPSPFPFPFPFPARASAVTLYRFIASLLLPLLAEAAVVYDNGAGGAAGIDNVYPSDPDNSTFAADDFIPTASATLLSVQWTGIYAYVDTPPATDSFTIVFYADAAGFPGTVVGTFPVGNAVVRTDSGVDLFAGSDIYSYEATVNQAVTLGTSYWLSVYNDTTADTDDNWFWGDIGGAGNSVASNNQIAWSSSDGQMDFVLEGTAVPEPGTAGLLMLGGCLGLFGRSRRRSS